MSNFHQKRKLKRFLYSPIVLVPLALIVFFLGMSVYSVYTKERETRVRRDKQMAELKMLEARAGALRSEIEKLSTERGREAEIRGKFEVAKEKPGFWQRIFSWF